MNKPSVDCSSDTGHKPRQLWIDMLRGGCMLAILLDHTEIYYTGTNIIPYTLYVPNALCVFFFLSGYLFLKPQGFSLRAKLVSITRGIILPYFIFTSLIAVPKALVHDHFTSLASLAYDIVSGQASWFVAALAVAEVLFAGFLHITRGKLFPLFLLFFGAFGLSTCFPTTSQPYFWQADNALQALIFLYAGYLYHAKEMLFNRFNTLSYSSLFFLLLLFIKVYETNMGISFMLWPLHIDNYPVFFIDILLTFLLVTSLFKQLPTCRPIAWTGAHSLVYYFFCGGVPLVLSTVISRFLPFTGPTDYLTVLLVFLLVYLFTSAIAWIVYRFFPITVGQMKKKG